jgi:hypothetical protein
MHLRPLSNFEETETAFNSNIRVTDHLKTSSEKGNLSSERQLSNNSNYDSGLN